MREQSRWALLVISDPTYRSLIEQYPVHLIAHAATKINLDDF
jgi:hypothetical protein